MDYVEIDGARVAYQVDGSGPALVLVSGTGGDMHSNWGHMIHTLARHRTVVRVDYSGAGTTTDDGGALTIPMLAKQVVAAARAADVGPFDLVGYSLGSCVAVHIAAEYPELVRSVVLLAGFTSSNDPRLQLQGQLWKDLVRTDIKLFARLVLLTGFSPKTLASMAKEQMQLVIDTIVRVNHVDGLLRQIELDGTLDVTGQARRISKRTLVIGCVADNVVPVEHARTLAATIPHARYAELPCGHMAPFECPDDFLMLTLGFLGLAE